MSNNELSIEQLEAINGGAAYVKLDGFRAARTSPLSADGKKTDLMAEATFAWLAPPWKKMNAVLQGDYVFQWNICV